MVRKRVQFLFNYFLQNMTDLQSLLKEKTPVSYLQEVCSRKKLTPTYDVLANEGPIHEPVFVIRAQAGDFQGFVSCQDLLACFAQHNIVFVEKHQKKVANAAFCFLIPKCCFIASCFSILKLFTTDKVFFLSFYTIRVKIRGSKTRLRVRLNVLK